MKPSKLFSVVLSSIAFILAFILALVNLLAFLGLIG